MKSTQKLLEEFDEAACYWGWQKEVGYGNAVRKAEMFYNKAKAALEKRIKRLEKLNLNKKV